MKNLNLIKKKLVIVVGVLLLIFCVLCIFFAKFTWISSAILGGGFSYLILESFLNTQNLILKSQKASSYFLNFVMRLALYGLPVFLGLAKKNYFNLAVILIFLFSFQISLITLMLIKGIKRLKGKETSLEG